MPCLKSKHILICEADPDWSTHPSPRVFLQDKIRELEQALVEQETMQMRMDAIERECHETQARVCVCKQWLCLPAYCLLKTCLLAVPDC